MAKNRKPSRRKAHIKHDKFKDLNISSLDDHPRAGKVIKSPFSVLGDNISPMSWRDYGLNEFLWAAIIRTTFDQNEALDFFRKIIIDAKNLAPIYDDTFISHSALSALSEDEFDKLMNPILLNDKACDALSALLYIECLPDRHHWLRYIKEPPTSDSHSMILMRAIGLCMEHQSQEATDIRWLKIMFFIIVQGRAQFPESMEERLEEYRLYPNKGDQRSVRPGIRSFGHNGQKCVAVFRILRAKS